MKPFRVTIAASLGAIVVFAIGLMGLREGTVLWASLAFGLSLVFLLGATLTALIGRPDRRPGWTGFTVVGWAYFACTFGPWPQGTPPPNPFDKGVAWLLSQVHPEPDYEPLGVGMNANAPRSSIEFFRRNMGARQLKPGSVVWTGNSTHFYQSAHAMGTLLFGAIGAAWGRWIGRRQVARDATPNSPVDPGHVTTESES